jgi:prepilin-type N-terminal cleavage/methylation domain-containing protein
MRKVFKSSKFSDQSGFTLLEILLVVTAIAILAGIVIVALNPNYQLGLTRNSQRKTDVGTILNAIYQYSLDNNGSLPTGIQTGGCIAGFTGAQICKTGGTCAGLTDLSSLTASGKYLVAMPTDPSGSGTNNTGYFVTKDANGRVTVCAPSSLTESSATASISASL